MPLPFFCCDVQKHAAVLQFPLCFGKNGKQAFQIVARIYAHIFQAVPFKQADVLDGRISAFKFFQNFVRAAYRGRNGHSVIVENDQNARIQKAQTVERLVDQTVIERTVADERDHVEIFPFQIARFGDSERGGKRGSRVSRIVAVVLALRAFGKSRDPAAASQRGKRVGAVGKKFVWIALMPHVKNDLISRKIKNAVQSYGKLHHAEIGREMSAAHGNGAEDFLADLFAQRL